MQHAKMGQVREKKLEREEKEDKEGSTCNEDMSLVDIHLNQVADMFLSLSEHFQKYSQKQES